MKSARTISNRIVMLHEGRIYADDSTDRILQSSDPILYNFVNGIAAPRAETV
jgi:phospholipid/cholesterol/gamma-HCH transport system ATP-binding protein